MKKILLLFFLFCNTAAFAQQDALFSQYTFNKLLVNPAYAGSREGLNVTVLNRSQWINLDGAPNTLTLSVHAALKERKVGLGFYVFRDEIGPTMNNGFMGTYSYRIFMGSGTFSLGLQAGLKYFDYDWTKMNLRDYDYVFDPHDVKKITPDFNLGLYYQSNRFFAGISSKQLLENEVGFAERDGKTSFSKLTRHFYFMTGGVIPMVDKIMFRPSALIKFVENAPVQVDINGSILFGKMFMAGLSYRTAKAVTFMTEFTLTNTIRLGYSYDYYFSDLRLHNYGSSEIRLEFDLSLNKSRMMTPRYF